MIQSTQLTREQYKEYFSNAISYEAYKKNFQDEMAQEEQGPYGQYLPQNWSRQSRMDRKLKLPEAIIKKVAKIEGKRNWLVITEHWCGDASQINPIIGKAAEISEGKIDLRFIYRDTNLELMDAHLTDGTSRSIPMLLVFDDDFYLLGQYGPRPDEAQVLVKSYLAKGESYMVPLHTWYAKDKQKSILDDVQNILSL